MFSMNTHATSRMGVWLPGFGLKGQAPSNSMLLTSIDVVVSYLQKEMYDADSCRTADTKEWLALLGWGEPAQSLSFG